MGAAVFLRLGCMRHVSRDSESSTICCSRHDALSITRYVFTPSAQILLYLISLNESVLEQQQQ
jgi:hypothetical protein